MNHHRPGAAEAAELERLETEQDEAIRALDDLDRRITLALAEWKREFVLVFPSSATQASCDEESPPMQQLSVAVESPQRAA